MLLENAGTGAVDRAGAVVGPLPEERAALVRVRMDAIGVIDFNPGRGVAGRDALRFADSGVHADGDMALRARWGADPTFVLAIGGFNPRFLAPAGIPRAGSAGVESVGRGRSAVTVRMLFSADIEHGAVWRRLDCGGWRVHRRRVPGSGCAVSFCAVRFVVDIGAGWLRYHGRLLMGIYLEGTLSGPTPWQVRGKATFKCCSSRCR